jgi:hypothetical protein
MDFCIVCGVPVPSLDRTSSVSEATSVSLCRALVSVILKESSEKVKVPVGVALTAKEST